MRITSKFYRFTNQSETNADLYIYGAITSDKNEDWLASESDVDLNDFKQALDNIGANSILNMYVNSPGGSVFAASTMVSMLRRAKETKKIKIKAYVDGLAASAASFLIMIADEIIMYSNSMLMIHKPLSFVYGNANDFQKEMDLLDTIENNVMIPLYEEKAKCDKKKIKDLIEAESWLSANEVDNFFNVILLEEEKQCAASIDKDLFKCYKNVPDKFKNEDKEPQKEEKPAENTAEPAEKPAEKVEEPINIDYSYFENILGGF